MLEKKNIAILLSNGDYDSVVNLLLHAKQEPSLEWVASFEDCLSPEILFCFLNYLIAKEDSAENRILLCKFVMYINEFFDDIYVTVRYHVLRPLPSLSERKELFEWALFVFDDGNPDAPFSEKELKIMRNVVSSTE